MFYDLKDIKKSIQVLSNIVKIGKVSSVNAVNGTIDVVFEDKDNMICPDLPLMDSEYKIPSIGDQVLCLFLPNGIQQGFCLGKFYSSINLPPRQDPSIICKKLDDNTYIEYNSKTKNLTINSSSDLTINTANNLTVNSDKDITINGKTIVNGEMTVKGDITANNFNKEGA